MTLSEIRQVLKDGIRGIKHAFFASNKKRFGYIHKSAIVYQPGIGQKNNVYLYEGAVIHEYHKFLTAAGKFIMRENSVASLGLTVITFNHNYFNLGDIPNGTGWDIHLPDDVIVNEHVWIGANVTLCPGTIIGRGSIVAAGSVCIKKQVYPPYSIIAGNPAKFIKFRLSLEDQIEQEKLIYKEENRIDIETLKHNYSNFIKR